MTIGVFFGSFNPIHLGHVAIAERFLQEDGIDEVWLSVSPHNPLKEKSELLATKVRVKMAVLATSDNKNIRVLNFEEDLPQPSFTYEALLELKKRYTKHSFILLIGGDNCGLFDRWRNYNKILNEFQVWAYPREISSIKPELLDAMRIIEAPLLDFAGTDIRNDIRLGNQPQGLPMGIWNYIKTNKLYGASNKKDF